MHTLTWIQRFCQGLRKSQQKTLAVFTAAVLLRQTACLAKLAKKAGFLSNVSAKSATKRLWRFLKNDKFDDEQVTIGLSHWIWPKMNKWKYIPISIDWTFNEKKSKWLSIMASISMDGRGIPIMVWSYRKGDYSPYLSQNQCEEAFVRRLLKLIPEDHRIVILADRGFGRASFFKFLDELEVKYVIRMSRNVGVKSRNFKGNLSELKLQPEQCFSLGETEYRKDGAVVLCNVIAALDPESDDDPWFLATNFKVHATTATKLYARRMIIEQDFKEAKSRLDWDESRIIKLSHYRRFTTLIILALAISSLVGRVARRRPKHAARVSRKKNGKWQDGQTSIGLALLEEELNRYLRFLNQLKLPAQPI